MNFFTLVYFLVAAIVTIVALPVLLLLSFKSKYKTAIPKRFFLYKNPPFETSGAWFHVCSFGEAISLKPLLQKLDTAVNISVTTTTGYNAARKYEASVRYLPFESLLPFWVKPQKVLVVAEAELWYMLFFMAKLRGSKTILMNARVSDRSHKRYQKFSWLYKRIFSLVDVVFAQSETDKVRLEALGATKVMVTGNIKAYGVSKATKHYPKQNKEVITLASTHATEEALLLAEIDYHDKKLIVVPRHPERFKEVGLLLKSFADEKGLSYHAFSQREDFDSDVIMIDKMGELINIYAISDVVFLGGSFVENVGGHNPLEPASFGCKVLSGMHIFNQRPLFELVENINIIELWEIKEYAQKEAGKTAIKGSVDIAPIIKAIVDVV